MSWYLYALLAAGLVSLVSIFEKKILSRDEHAMEYATTLSILALVVSLPFFWVIDYSALTGRVLAILGGIAIVGGTAFLLIAKAVKHMEVSSVSPWLVLAPGLTALLAYPILGEKLSSQQILGLVLLLVGAFVLELKPHHKLSALWTDLKRERYLPLILVAIVLYTFTALADRFVLSRYHLAPITYLAFINLFLALYFIITSAIWHDGLRGVRHSLKTAGLPIFLVAVLVVGHRFALINAVGLAFIGLAVAVKRSSSLFTTILGGEIFHEHNILRKSLACVIMLLGVVLVAI